MKQRQALLRQGDTDPSRRSGLQDDLRKLNRRLLQTPSYDFHDPRYTRGKFLRYADDAIVGIIGPKQLAEDILEEVAQFLKDDLRLELNREKTHILHLPTEKAHFLGYAFKTAQPRLRHRNLKQKGSAHNVIQTVKTMTGNIQLLVPFKELTPKLKKYMAKGQPASLPGLINQPVEHILEHYTALLRGWYRYYQLASNVSRLNYARYVLQYSLAKTLARKERLTVGAVFRKYGKDLTFRKPNGREIHFFNQPLTQVKRAQITEAHVDEQPAWGPRRTRTRLLDQCSICGSGDRVEMHHVRHIRKHGEHVQGFTLYLAAINRKQIPVCHQCHQDIHRGKYDGADLSQILGQIQAPESGT
jgi:nicotine oxidoreductase